LFVAALGWAQPAPVTVALPGSPFAVRTSADGQWLYVSLARSENSRGVAVMRYAGGKLQLLRVAPTGANTTGLALTHDGKQLIATTPDSILFLDTAKLTSGSGDPVLGRIATPPRSQNIWANVTPDDKVLFVSQESSASIAVIDLEKRTVMGSIPVGHAPIALTFSPDGRTLYTTSQVALAEWDWPKACRPEGRPGVEELVNPEGAVIVIDVARRAVTAKVPAGCSPVRAALAPDGSRLYVTARNSNAVLAFDTAKLARVGSAAVGTAPVPVAVVNDGRTIVAGNSNRFGGSSETQTLTVLDAAKMTTVGIVAVGAFPRDLTLSPDGKTLFVANFDSNSVQAIAVAGLAPR
jgi:YVTN family beta-propeller protein